MNPTGCWNWKRKHKIESISDWFYSGKILLQKIPDEPISSLYAITAAVLEKPKSWVLAHQDCVIEPEKITQLRNMVNELVLGKPLAYILGQQSFFGQDFIVTPDTLIPRPETELLVENAIQWLTTQKKELSICDVGTGSGCIAISIAKHSKNIRILAVDNSWKSILVARENVKKHNLKNRVFLLVADLIQSIHSRFDLVCANLPYIPTVKLNNLENLKFEPRSALDGGDDGLTHISRLINQAKEKINTPGLILLEFESEQSNAIDQLLKNKFPNQNCTVIHDYGNRPRLARIAF